MSTDQDLCIPKPLKDFLFDLHDSVRASQIQSEQCSLYHGTFRELNLKYFTQGPWPSPHSISMVCGDDSLFLALYKELTQRYFYSTTRPNVSDRVDGWHVYRTLFDLILDEASDNVKTEQCNKYGSFFIFPDWAFDILHEFVYQFQGFCQLRVTTFANAAKHGTQEGILEKKKKMNNVMEVLNVLSSNRDAWAVETVLFYLHRMVSVGEETLVPVFKYLGIFASVTLSRLECLLGDYRACLSALLPIKTTKSQISSLTTDEQYFIHLTAEEIVLGVFPARLSVAYHAGVSYLMLRKYKDAVKILSDICFFMQRGFKIGHFKNFPASDQFSKLYDRMIALLAILTHVCTVPGLVDESVCKTVRDKHGKQLSKIDSGEVGYEDLFIFACPKFISPAVPDYNNVTTLNTSFGHLGQDAYKLQVKHFIDEMASQHRMRKLKSYMKLYKSISVSKLGRLVIEDDILPLLLTYKQKMQQTGVSGESGEAPFDVGYFIHDDIIYIEEERKQSSFEHCFISRISQNSQILKDVEGILID